MLRMFLYPIFTAIVFLIALPGISQDWNQWRGPQRDGILHNTSAEFLQGDNKRIALDSIWSTEIGSGYGSPISDGQALFTLTRSGEMEVVSAINADDGKLLWQQQYPAPFKTNQYALKFGKGPFSTPAVVDGRLFTLGIGAVLSCWDAKSGKLIWRNTLSDSALDTETFFVGTAMSPLIDNGRCIVHIGEENQGALIAYDVTDGSEVWRWEGDKPGYASPVIATFRKDGKALRQIITLSQNNCVGLDAGSGELLWQIPFTSKWRENIVTPVVFDNSIIFSGVKRGIFRYDIEFSGETWQARKVWHNPDISMYMNSPVKIGPALYGLAHTKKGQLFCLEAATGKVRWLSDGRIGENAAIIAAGKQLMITTTAGELLVVSQKSDQYQELLRLKLSGTGIWGYPVVTENYLVFKDDEALMRWNWRR